MFKMPPKYLRRDLLHSRILAIPRAFGAPRVKEVLVGSDVSFEVICNNIDPLLE
jgi:hypothetical protein